MWDDHGRTGRTRVVARDSSMNQHHDMYICIILSVNSPGDVVESCVVGIGEVWN